MKKSLLVFFLTLTATLPLNAKTVITAEYSSGERSAESDTISVTVPLYKFKNDATGRFLSQFCDSLYSCHSLFNSLEIDQIIGEMRIPHEGPVDEYVYLSSRNMKPEIIADIQGVIEKNGYGKIFFRDISDSTKQLLHIEPTDTLINIRYGFTHHDDMIDYIINDSEMHSLLHIKEDGKVDPVLIYRIYGKIQKNPSLMNAFEWIEDFYAENGQAPGAAYENQSDLFDYFFIADSMPRTPLTYPVFNEPLKDNLTYWEYSVNDLLNIKNGPINRWEVIAFEKTDVNEENPIKVGSLFSSYTDEPAYPDGDEVLLNFFDENIVYPETALKEKIYGGIIVSFTIEKDGSFSNIRIDTKRLYQETDETDNENNTSSSLESQNRRPVESCPELEEEALRVVELMKPWIPAKNNGRPVKSTVRLPIVFRLN